MHTLKKLFLVALLILGNIACNTCDNLSDTDAIECLAKQPIRDLSASAKAQNFLATHKVYITMTTSPQRLGKIEPTLRTLDLTNVEKVYLALPKLYRNKEPYDLSLVEPILARYPKLEIIAREQQDLGPIMKMLPAIELVAENDPDALVISIDDDSGYSKGMLNEFIYHMAEHPGTIFSGWGNYVELHGIIAAEWPKQGKAYKSPLCGSGPFTYCDTVEGWRGIAYRPRLVNTKRLRELSNISKACRTSDDIVISYVLAESGHDKVRINNKYNRNFVQFKSNYDAGALHRVKVEKPGWTPRKSVDNFYGWSQNSTNPERYQRCVLDIIEESNR